jgi:hypothetical protein
MIDGEPSVDAQLLRAEQHLLVQLTVVALPKLHVQNVCHRSLLVLQAARCFSLVLQAA